MKTIRIARSEGFECSPRGVRQFYPQGDYKIPDDMPPEIARRCVESGIGAEVRTKDTAPKNKAQPPPSHKKKRSKKKTGQKR